MVGSGSPSLRQNLRQLGPTATGTPMAGGGVLVRVHQVRRANAWAQGWPIDLFLGDQASNGHAAFSLPPLFRHFVYERLAICLLTARPSRASVLCEQPLFGSA